MIASHNTLVIGDGWASAVVAGSKDQFGGWPVYLGIPKNKRLAVPGFGAHEWYTNKQNCMKEACDLVTSGEIDLVIVSFMGELLHNLKQLRKANFIKEAKVAAQQTATMIALLGDTGATVMSMLYANPSPGNSEAGEMVDLLNELVVGISRQAFDTPNVVKGRSDAFDGKGTPFLTTEGHLLLAQRLSFTMNLMHGRSDDAPVEITLV